MIDLTPKFELMVWGMFAISIVFWAGVVSLILLVI